MITDNYKTFSQHLVIAYDFSELYDFHYLDL